MNFLHKLHRSVLAFTLLVGLHPVAWSQAYPTQDLLITSTTVVGETLHYPSSGPAQVTVSIVTIRPGTNTALHRHAVPLVAYILDGELTVDYVGKGQKIFRQGDALVEAMDVPHHGMNQGATPVKILAVYLGAKGAANVTLEPTNPISSATRQQ